MTDGILKSVSQRIGREETQENRRIQEIADELRRRCCLHEKEVSTPPTQIEITTYMAALGFNTTEKELLESCIAVIKQKSHYPIEQQLI